MPSPLKNLLLVACAAVSLGNAACGQELPRTVWVDPRSGATDGSGSKESPWRTLAESASSVQALPPGSVVRLCEGDHGAVRLRAEGLTIEAVEGHRPRLARLEFDGSNTMITGLTVSPSFGDGDFRGAIVVVGGRHASNKVTVADCFVFDERDATEWTADDWRSAKSGMEQGRHGEELIFRNNFVLHTRFAMQLDAPHSKAIGNVISGFSADGIRVTRDGIEVSHNVIKNCHVSIADGDKNHDDAIQCFLFNKGSGTVRDVVVRGNVIVSRERDDLPWPSRCQGIGFFDGPLVRFNVSDNVLLVEHWHGVALYDAQDCTVQNNACYSRWPGKMRPWVRLGQKQDQAAGNRVIDNMAHSFHLEADDEVEARGNTRVVERAFDARLRQALNEIEKRYGARHALSGLVRLQQRSARPPK